MRSPFRMNLSFFTKLFLFHSVFCEEQQNTTNNETHNFSETFQSLSPNLTHNPRDQSVINVSSSSSSSSSSLPSTPATIKHLCRYHPVDREILAKQHTYFFHWIEEKLQSIATNVSHNRFVALRPTKFTNAGFGNVLLLLVEVLGMALGSERFPILNQAAFHALFQHPLLGQLGGNWSLHTNDEVLNYFQNKRTSGYSELSQCGKVAENPLKTFGGHYYLDACLGNNMMHPEIRQNLASLLKIQFAIDTAIKGEYHEWWKMNYSYLFHWALSKLQPTFHKAVDVRVRAIKDLCFGSDIDDPIDVAIHARLFQGIVCTGSKDQRKECDISNHDKFNQSAGFHMLNNCILQQLREASLRKAASSYPDIARRPICIFLTADVPHVEKHIKAKLKSHFGPHLRGTIVTSSELRKHLHLPRSPQTISPQTGRPMFIASDALMQKNRDVANLTELLQYPEFTAWAILKEALSVVRTGESTFSQTARLAHGYFNMRHDLEIVPWSYEHAGKNTKWKCVRSLDKQLMCDYCLRLFSTNSTTLHQQNGTTSQEKQPQPQPQPQPQQNSTSSYQLQNSTSSPQQQPDPWVGVSDNGTTITNATSTTTTTTVTNLCPVDVIKDCRVIMCDKCLALGTGECPRNLMNFCEFQ